MKGKHTKRILSLVMAMTLVFSLGGCTKTPPTENPSGSLAEKQESSTASGEENSGSEGVGRWAERDVTPANLDYAMQTPMLMDDGTLAFYGREASSDTKLFYFSSKDDGETWDKQEVAWCSQVEGRVSSLCMLPSGYCVLASYLIDDEENAKGCILWRVKDGNLVRIKDSEDIVYSIQLFDEETMLVSQGDLNGYEKVYLMNSSTGAVIKEVMLSGTVTGIYGCALDRSEEGTPKLYYAQYTDSAMELYVMDKNGDSKKCVGDLSISCNMGTADEEGNYYFLVDGGICRIAKDGTILEQIMDDDGFQLGLSNNYCMDMSYINKEEFFVELLNSNEEQSVALIKYYWSTEPVPEVSSHIKIWSLKDNATVKAAIFELKKTNPEIEVTYEVGIENEEDTYDEAIVEETIRNLNTRLLSDDAPDVLVLDDLDYENYKEKGYLADIADTIKFADMQSNIMNPFLNDGKCYAIPARFSVPVLMGDSGDVDSMKTLDDLKRAVLECSPRPGDDLSKDGYYEEWSESERYALGFSKLEKLVDYVLSTSAPALVENGRVNHDNLVEVMDFINTVGTHYGMKRYPVDAIENCTYASGGFDPIMLEDGGYEYGVTHHARFGWGRMDSPSFFSESRRDDREEKSTGNIVSQPGLIVNSYFPTTMLAVMETSKDKEAAKKLIGAALSSEVQMVCYGDGIPVLKSALEYKIESHKEFVTEKGYKGDMQAFYDSLENPIIDSIYTDSMRKYILTHSKAMINGEESLDAAVNGVENDVKIMFQERN